MLKVEELKLSIEPAASSVLTKVSKFLSEQGIKSYLVGGFVRDILLGRATADIDIAVDADALDVGSKIAVVVNGKYVPLDEINRVCRIVLADEGRLELDISTLKGDIEQDLAQRDFTIDAMAIDLSALAKGVVFHIIDPFNGQRDIRWKLVRVVSDESFKSDAVRLLRAVRLAAELGFGIEEETEALIQHYWELITDVSGERIREELLRLLAVPESGEFLLYLDKLGLVTAIVPELAKAKGVEQPKEHFWDVFNHSIRAAIAADFLLRQGSWLILEENAAKEVLVATPWTEVLANHFEQDVSHGSTRRTLLKLAGLLHDIAKPQTKTIEADGRMRFFEHAREGAAIVAGILGRLRFSAKEIKLVETIAKHHLRPMQTSHDGFPTRRAIYRYFRDTGHAAIDTLFLSLADHLATRGPKLNLAGWQEHAKVVKYILDVYFEPQAIAPSKLIDGHDLINILGLKPGAQIGELLEAVREAQAVGELTSREEALSFVRKRLSNTKQDNKYD